LGDRRKLQKMTSFGEVRDFGKGVQGKGSTGEWSGVTASNHRTQIRRMGGGRKRMAETTRGGVRRFGKTPE